MRPKIGDGLQQPGFAHAPVFALVANLLEKPHLGEKLLEKADRLVVRDLFGPVFAEERVFGADVMSRAHTMPPAYFFAVSGLTFV